MSDTINKAEIIRDKDISVYLDAWASQINFDENFVEVEGEDNTYLYVEYGNLSKDIDYSILPRQKGKVINAILTEEITDWTRAELVAMDIETVYEHFTSSYNVADLIEICNEYDIKTERDNYLEIEVVGYSQGDRATVLINKAEALKVWGSKDIDEVALKEELTNYFYNSPSSVRITILGSEYISERFDGVYQSYQGKDNYNKDEFITELKEYFKDEIEDLDFFEEQLEEYLPYELEYED